MDIHKFDEILLWIEHYIKPTKIRSVKHPNTTLFTKPRTYFVPGYSRIGVNGLSTNRDCTSLASFFLRCCLVSSTRLFSIDPRLEIKGQSTRILRVRLTCVFRAGFRTRSTVLPHLLLCVFTQIDGIRPTTREG